MLSIRTGTLASRVLLATCFGLAITPKAWAIDFWIENKTQKVVLATVGYYSPKGTYNTEAYGRIENQSPESEWVAEGWYKVDPGASRKVYTGPRSGIFLRIAAERKENCLMLPEWKGEGYHILPWENGWPVDWKHDGFRLCYGDTSKLWGLWYGDQYAKTFDELPGRSFRFYYPNNHEGSNVTDVGCAYDKGYREVRFSDKPSHLLTLTQDQNGFGFRLGARN